MLKWKWNNVSNENILRVHQQSIEAMTNDTQVKVYEDELE